MKFNLFIEYLKAQREGHNLMSEWVKRVPKGCSRGNERRLVRRWPAKRNQNVRGMVVTRGGGITWSNWSINYAPNSWHVLLVQARYTCNWYAWNPPKVSIQSRVIAIALFLFPPIFNFSFSPFSLSADTSSQRFSSVHTRKYSVLSECFSSLPSDHSFVESLPQVVSHTNHPQT